MSETESLLPYDSWNEDKTTTIFLIHGAFGSKEDWHATAAHLDAYHLLIPSYHASPTSHGIKEKDFTIDTAVTRLAALLRAKAKSSVAHIVGLSLGSHLALRLAGLYPELALTVLGTGCNRVDALSPWKLYPAYAWSRLEAAVPALSKLTTGASAVPAERRPPSVLTVKLLRNAVRATVQYPHALPIPRRTLLVAATHKTAGLVAMDFVSSARQCFDDFTSGHGAGMGSRAVQNTALQHCWIIQKPELAATVVLAWIEDRRLPDGFVSLDP